MIEETAKSIAQIIFWFVGWALFGVLIYWVANAALLTWFNFPWPYTVEQSAIAGFLIGLAVTMYIIKMERAT